MTNQLLSDKDTKILSDLAEELEETFNKVQVHRTRTEMEVSVLNDLKFPTPASKYWQAMREQSVMLSGTKMLSFEYRIEQVRLKKILRKIEQTEDDLDKELLQIKKEQKEYKLREMKRIASHKVKEILEWSSIKKRESKTMTEEELADVGNHQLISYTKRWINQAIEMGDNGSPSEKQNLVGQLKSGLAMCKEKNVLLDVLSSYNKEQQQQLIEVANG